MDNGWKLGSELTEPNPTGKTGVFSTTLCCMDLVMPLNINLCLGGGVTVPVHR